MPKRGGGEGRGRKGWTGRDGKLIEQNVIEAGRVQTM